MKNAIIFWTLSYLNNTPSDLNKMIAVGQLVYQVRFLVVLELFTSNRPLMYEIWFYIYFITTWNPPMCLALNKNHNKNVPTVSWRMPRFRALNKTHNESTSTNKFLLTLSIKEWLYKKDFICVRVCVGLQSRQKRRMGNGWMDGYTTHYGTIKFSCFRIPFSQIPFTNCFLFLFGTKQNSLQTQRKPESQKQNFFMDRNVVTRRFGGAPSCVKI